MRNWFRQHILESPVWKTALMAVGTILAGVLCGTFVTEITDNGKLVWGQFYESVSFYALLGIVAAMFLYNREIYLYERDIIRFKDAEFCLAYVRSKCLPAAVEVYAARIRAGDIGELEEAMKEVKRILK